MKKIISNLKKLFRASEYAVAFELIKGLDQPELLTPISDIILKEFKKLKKSRCHKSADELIKGISALNMTNVFEILLDGCELGLGGKRKWHEGCLIRNDIFSGGENEWGVQQSFNDYVLLNLIGYAPEECNVSESIKRKNITVLHRTGYDYDSRIYGAAELSLFPEGICNMTNLKHLDLSHNSFNFSQKNSEEIGKLKKLEILDLSFNGMGKINNIGALQKLQKLNLYSCGLKSIPTDIITLNELRVLNVGGNQITSLPPRFLSQDSLIKLEELNLEENKLTSFPKEFLSHPVFFKYSFSPGNLKGQVKLEKNPFFMQVESLNTFLADVGNNVKFCNYITNHYGSNKINQYCKKRLLPLISKKEALAVTSLDISGYNKDKYSGIDMRLTKYPEFIEGYENLTSLSLTHHLIEEIPVSLTKIKSLKNLDISFNKLTILPKSISQLSSLTDLNIDSNNIQFLPNEIGNLSKIRSLVWNSSSVSNTDLAKSFKALSTMKGLERLHLKLTQVVSLPPEIGQLQNIKSLTLETPKLISLPKEFGKLKRLEELEFLRCTNLTNVDSVIHLQINVLKMQSCSMDNCKNVKPLPRPMFMETRNEVVDYCRRIIKNQGGKTTNPEYSKRSENEKEVKKKLSKLKKFIKERDFDRINQGIELCRSLADPMIFESLLEGCSISIDGELVRNKLFKGSGPAQPFLDYALLEVIKYASDNSNIHKSLKKENIVMLKLPACASNRKETWELILDHIKPDQLNFNSVNLTENLQEWLVEQLAKKNEKRLFELLLKDVFIVKIGYVYPNGFVSEIGGLLNYGKWGKSAATLHLLLDLISIAPDNSNIDPSIQRKNITELKIGISYMESLSKFPKSICNLVNLESLRIGSRDSNWSFPSEISKLKNLKRLDMYDLDLNAFPIEICELSSLEELDISNNRFGKIPPEIARLTNLKILALREIQNVTKCPSNNGTDLSSLKMLPNLESLDLRKNQLSLFPDILFKLKKLKSLILSDNQIVHIPEEIGVLKNLEILYLDNMRSDNSLSYTGIKELPKEISKLEKLKILSVKSFSANSPSCSLSKFPDQIFELKSLEYLNLAFHSLISVIPSKIGNLINLKELVLSKCSIEKIPVEMSKLVNLESLILFNEYYSSYDFYKTHVDNNQKYKIAKFGESGRRGIITGQYEDGTDIIYFTNNFIQEWPDSLKKLKKLSVIKLDFNNISDSDCQKIKRFYPEANIVVNANRRL